MNLWEQIKNMPKPKPTVFPHIIQWLPDGSKLVATNRDTIEIQKFDKTFKTFYKPFNSPMSPSIQTQIKNLKVSTNQGWVKVSQDQRAEILKELPNLSEEDQKEILAILETIPVLEETKKDKPTMEAPIRCNPTGDICEGCSI